MQTFQNLTHFLFSKILRRLSESYDFDDVKQLLSVVLHRNQLQRQQRNQVPDEVGLEVVLGYILEFRLHVFQVVLMFECFKEIQNEINEEKDLDHVHDLEEGRVLSEGSQVGVQVRAEHDHHHLAHEENTVPKGIGREHQEVQRFDRLIIVLLLFDFLSTLTQQDLFHRSLGFLSGKDWHALKLQLFIEMFRQDSELSLIDLDLLALVNELFGETLECISFFIRDFVGHEQVEFVQS